MILTNEFEFITDYKKAVDNIRKIVKDYILKNNLKSLILGVSGGIDSTLVAALCKPVCDGLNIPLIGRSITIETNSIEEKYRSEHVGKNFCTEFQHIDLSSKYFILKNIFDSKPIIDNIESDREIKIRLGNVKARIRMIYLYDIAQKNKGLVLSTDQVTEYLLGFWTKNGDDFDFGPIQKLWKTEVYEMTEFLSNLNDINNDASISLKETLNADATDGLGITSTDLDQLLPDWRERHKTTREGYAEVDKILYHYISTGENINDNVIKRHINSEFKRNLPINIERNMIYGDDYLKIIDLYDINNYKYLLK